MLSLPVGQHFLCNLTMMYFGDLFEGVPEPVRRQVLVDNVCDFYDLDPEKELTPTP